MFDENQIKNKGSSVFSISYRNNFAVRNLKLNIMKTTNFYLSVIFISVFFFANCGSGGVSSTKKNGIFGEIPSIEKNYVEKIEKQDEALKNATDVNKAIKLSQEIDLMKEEWDNKIKEIFAAGLPSETVPFKAVEQNLWEVEQVKVASASRGHMSLTFSVKILEDIKNKYGQVEGNLFIYFVAIDKDGNPIEYTKSIAANIGRERMKADTQLDLTGVWKSKAIRNLENFASLQQITKEEYEK